MNVIAHTHRATGDGRRILRGRLALGSVRGIPIAAHWSVLAIVLLVAYLLAAHVLPALAPERGVVAYWTAGAIGAMLLLASLLVHELAHSVMALRYGVRVDRITLWMLGGVAEFAEESPHARAELRIAVVGPLASLVISIGGFALAALVATIADPLLLGVVIWVAATNLVIAVFNMLPGAPLDGGRVLRAVLWRRTGDRERSSQHAARVGRGLGIGLIAFGAIQVLVGAILGLWLMLIGWFLVSAATIELGSSVERLLLAGVRVDEVMRRHPVVVRADVTVRSVVDAIAMRQGQRVLPVVDSHGMPVGVVSLTDLARVPPEARASTMMADVGRPLREGSIVAPDDDMAGVIARSALLPGRDLLIVTDGGELVGTVSAEDVRSGLEIAALRASGRDERSVR
ncbi:site-2 protease family protein [Haloechinothrix sp. LS1_15]|uniref:site-2 protease family protein n=1 Tax=Haloechinothrix sp. LS1_15 TaxID=2652248 RepID=UPI00294B00B6|nr:site-2 protease family protein [Haloechinothrix sp. LS1_15]